MRFVSSCLLLLSVSAVAWSQAGNTPSHRALPIGDWRKVPTREQFKSPEYRDLQQQLNQLANQAEQLRRQRDPNIQAPQRPESGDSRPESDEPKETGEQIKRVAEQVGRMIGGGISEILNPNRDSPTERQAEPVLDERVPADANVVDQLRSVRRALSAQRDRDDEEFHRAIEAYKNMWLGDNVPAQEWMQKVQPYISPELVRQIKEFRAEQTEKQDRTPSTLAEKNTQSSVSGGSSQSQGKTTQPTNRMLDSVFKSLDEQSAEWLKKAQGRKSNNKSWWKEIKAKTRNRMKSLNRRIAQNASTQRSRSVAVRRRGSDSSVALPSVNDISLGSGFWWVAGAVALLVVGLVLWRNADVIVPKNTTLAPVTSTQIRDRDSLLLACHQLAANCFGWPSRFWNHRTVFTKLGERSRQQAENARQLSQLYEHARYAPDGNLSTGQLDLARRLFQQLKDNVSVAA